MTETGGEGRSVSRMLVESSDAAFFSPISSTYCSMLNKANPCRIPATMWYCTHGFKVVPFVDCRGNAGLQPRSSPYRDLVREGDEMRDCGALSTNERKFESSDESH